MTLTLGTQPEAVVDPTSQARRTPARSGVDVVLAFGVAFSAAVAGLPAKAKAEDWGARASFDPNAIAKLQEMRRTGQTGMNEAEKEMKANMESLIAKAQVKYPKATRTQIISALEKQLPQGRWDLVK